MFSFLQKPQDKPFIPDKHSEHAAEWIGWVIEFSMGLKILKSQIAAQDHIQIQKKQAGYFQTTVTVSQAKLSAHQIQTLVLLDEMLMQIQRNLDETLNQSAKKKSFIQANSLFSGVDVQRIPLLNLEGKKVLKHILQALLTCYANFYIADTGAAQEDGLQLLTMIYKNAYEQAKESELTKGNFFAIHENHQSLQTIFGIVKHDAFGEVATHLVKYLYFRMWVLVSLKGEVTAAVQVQHARMFVNIYRAVSLLGQLGMEIFNKQLINECSDTKLAFEYDTRKDLYHFSEYKVDSMYYKISDETIKSAKEHLEMAMQKSFSKVSHAIVSNQLPEFVEAVREIISKGQAFIEMWDKHILKNVPPMPNRNYMFLSDCQISEIDLAENLKNLHHHKELVSVLQEEKPPAISSKQTHSL